MLHEASRYGHLDVLTFLLDEKSSRNVETKGGKTALDEASLNDHLDIVKFLVDNKADINGKDKRGETPPDQTNLGIHTDVAKYPRSKGRGGGHDVGARILLMMVVLTILLRLYVEKNI